MCLRDKQHRQTSRWRQEEEQSVNGRGKERGRVGEKVKERGEGWGRERRENGRERGRG